MAGRNFGTLLLLLLFVLLVLGTATLIMVINNSGSGNDGPAPAPATGAVCDWCDDLTDRVGGSVSASDKAGCQTLMQPDFAAGTFIAATADACYILGEDIVFHPAPGRDFRATAEPYASDPAFVLDFPAAILVRASGVSIDLGGHEIRQSRVHHVQQRFFATIELTTPFIAGQGPADFVGGLETADVARFVLRNGRMGLSSHHAIHGNGAWSVFIHDVDMVDYEVAAVALNGVHDVVLRRVRALGTLAAVPVIGTYSSARFLMPVVRRALAMARARVTPIGVVSAATAHLESVSAHLQQLMDQVASDVGVTGAISARAHAEAHALFGNPSGVPDGSAGYGFVLHAHGAAVNGFSCDRSAPKHVNMHHILIEDCEVRNTLLHTVEVPVLEEAATGTIQRGPVGDVLRIADIVAGDGMSYAGTALSQVKVALGEMRIALALPPTEFGTLAVARTVLRWAHGETGALAAAVVGGEFRYMRNCDNMFHVNKGAIGIRVDGGHHIAIRRTTVSGVVSTGDPANFDPLPGETAASAYWTGSADGGHPGADPQHGYGGADSVGISVAAASDVLLDAVVVRGVHARAGWATGLYIFNDASGVVAHDISIFNVTALTDPTIKLVGPKQPRAAGVGVTTDASRPVYTGTLDIQNIQSGRIGMASNELVDNTGIDGCSPTETNFYAL